MSANPDVRPHFETPKSAFTERFSGAMDSLSELMKNIETHQAELNKWIESIKNPVAKEKARKSSENILEQIRWQKRGVKAMLLVLGLGLKGMMGGGETKTDVPKPVAEHIMKHEKPRAETSSSAIAFDREIQDENKRASMKTFIDAALTLTSAAGEIPSDTASDSDEPTPEETADLMQNFELPLATWSAAEKVILDAKSGKLSTYRAHDTFKKMAHDYSEQHGIPEDIAEQKLKEAVEKRLTSITFDDKMDQDKKASLLGTLNAAIGNRDEALSSFFFNLDSGNMEIIAQDAGDPKMMNAFIEKELARRAALQEKWSAELGPEETADLRDSNALLEKFWRPYLEAHQS